LQVGAAVQILGAALLYAALSSTQTYSYWHMAPGMFFSFWHIAPGMFFSGLGTGLVIAALFDAILLSIKDELVGSASGVLSSVQSIGSSVGVAIFGTVFFKQVDLFKIDQGFKNALILQASLIVLFLILTLFLPKKINAEAVAV